MILHFPAITLVAAAVLGLLFVALSVRVVMGRMSGRVMMGEGEGETNPLQVAIRSHANFAEYVPLCLLLIAGLEMHTGPTLLVKLLAAALVLARLSHPIGMILPAPNPFRAVGFAGTLLVVLVASLADVATFV